MKIELSFGAWSLVICVGKYAEHPLRELIGAGEGDYDDFDLAKEREAMWPEDDENLRQIHRPKGEYW
jgi:hypothetical protein